MPIITHPGRFVGLYHVRVECCSGCGFELLCSLRSCQATFRGLYHNQPVYTRQPNKTMSVPSYYPPGWNKDRWQTATEAEFSTLTAEQFETFHTGLRAHLGEDGAEAFFAEMDQRQFEVTGSAPGAAPLSTQPPNFLRTLQRAFGGNEEWGFVVFLTAGNEDAGAVDQVKERVTKEVLAQMTGEGQVQNAKEKFWLMWVDGPDLEGAGAAEIARCVCFCYCPSGTMHVTGKILHFVGDTGKWRSRLALTTRSVSVWMLRASSPYKWAHPASRTYWQCHRALGRPNMEMRQMIRDGMVCSRWRSAP